MWYQSTIRLPAHPRGFHLITDEVERRLPELSRLHVGLCHLFLQHTSAGLTLNENADPSVRQDFEAHMNVLVPENARHYRHTLEGPDDMPAHLKTALLGSALSIPVTAGRLNLGTWQGVYLCEYRDRGGPRSLIVTLFGA